ncbi:Clavaminate synthase-like protein, partial [Aureobasidium melanogenum]
LVCRPHHPQVALQTQPSHCALGSVPFEALEDAFGPDSLGIIVVRDLPLSLVRRLGSLYFVFKHSCYQAKLEDPQSSYLVGWSCGKETLKDGRFDTLKGSYYANPVQNPELHQKAIDKFPNLPEYTAANIWPSSHVLPGFEQAFQSLCTFIVDTAALVAQACDRYALKNVPQYQEGYLEHVVKTSISTKARLLHYYAPTTDQGEGESSPDDWCATHLDHGCLTGLTSAMFSCPHLRTRQLGYTSIPALVRLGAAPGKGGQVARNTLAVFTQPNLWEMVDEKQVRFGTRFMLDKDSSRLRSLKDILNHPRRLGKEQGRAEVAVPNTGHVYAYEDVHSNLSDSLGRSGPKARWSTRVSSRFHNTTQVQCADQVRVGYRWSCFNCLELVSLADEADCPRAGSFGTFVLDTRNMDDADRGVLHRTTAKRCACAHRNEADLIQRSLAPPPPLPRHQCRPNGLAPRRAICKPPGTVSNLESSSQNLLRTDTGHQRKLRAYSGSRMSNGIFEPLLLVARRARTSTVGDTRETGSMSIVQPAERVETTLIHVFDTSKTPDHSSENVQLKVTGKKDQKAPRKKNKTLAKSRNKERAEREPP